MLVLLQGLKEMVYFCSEYQRYDKNGLNLEYISVS